MVKFVLELLFGNRRIIRVLIMCEAGFCGILHKITTFVVEIFLLLIAFHTCYLPRCDKIIILLKMFRHGSTATDKTKYPHTKNMLLFYNVCQHMFQITLMRLVHVQATIFCFNLCYTLCYV